MDPRAQLVYGQKSFFLLNLIALGAVTSLIVRLTLPIDFLGTTRIDLSQTQIDTPWHKPLGKTEVVNFRIADQGPYRPRDVTPPTSAEQRQRRNWIPKRHYLVPLLPPDEAELAPNKPIVAALLRTPAATLEEAISDLPLVSGQLRMPIALGWVDDRLKERDGVTELRERTGRKVLILEKEDHPAPLFITLFSFLPQIGLAACLCAGLSARRKRLIFRASAPVFLVGAIVWLIWLPASPSVATTVELVAGCLASTGLSLMLAPYAVQVLKALFTSNRKTFSYDERTPDKSQLLEIGQDCLRLRADDVELTIEDSDVLGVTWLFNPDRVKKNEHSGQFINIILHKVGDERQATSVTTTYRSKLPDYDPAVDRLAEYRHRVADLRAAQLARTLKQTGSVSGDKWSISRRFIKFTRFGGSETLVARDKLMSCRWIDEEFVFYRRGAELPERVPSSTTDQMIFARVLETIADDSGHDADAESETGMILARFTSHRWFPSLRITLPKWLIYGNGFLLVSLQGVLLHYIESISTNIAVPIVCCLAMMFVTFGIVAFTKWNARHLDLCEHGLRITHRKRSRFLPWESIRNGAFQRISTGGVFGFRQEVRLEIESPEWRNQDAELVEFIWDGGLGGEARLLERFLSICDDDAPQHQLQAAS